MKYIRIIIVLTLSLPLSNLMAQQENQFTQYTFNQAIINPAYIGSNNYINLQISSRNQWLGFPGAPKSNALSLGYPLKYFNSAIGISALQDNVGPLHNTLLTFVYSHAIKINDKLKLSMGLNAGTNHYAANLEQLNTNDNSDAILMQGSVQRTSFTFGSGVFLYAPNWYVGLSIPKIVTGKYFFGDDGYDTYNLTERNHIYLISGYVFGFKDGKIKLKPSACVKKVANVKPSIDLSLATQLFNKFAIGGGVRNPDNYFAFTQITVGKYLNIGYAYDFSGSRMRNYTKGSHEIILDVRLNRDATKVHSPRFF